MSKSTDLYKRAKKIIPGGTQLLSKRPEMFLPEIWPAYYSKAKGCEVWDLDETRYIDASYMGIGANVLGYAYEPVDNAAIEAVKNGGMCTLNAPEEVELAEKLCALHPWADMVRYSNSGGEGMTMAVRIARAYAKKDVVLACGYHGWHDWYLAANLVDDDPLEGVHLAGLEPAGVPKALKGSIHVFKYNDIERFHHLIKKYKGQIAAIAMEPIRNSYPKNGFLDEIRTIASQEGIVLIFDEISSGFRLCAGGSHLKLGVSPDIAVFAKGMSNGYPMSAVIGKGEIMTKAEETFISSTYWTQRIPYAATIKTISEFIDKNVDKHMQEIGAKVQKGWSDAAADANVSIAIGGILPLSHFTFIDKNPLLCKTFFTQEMLKHGYLASTAFYSSYAHSPQMVNTYMDKVKEVFSKLSLYNNEGSLDSKIEGPVCHSGFNRLN